MRTLHESQTLLLKQDGDTLILDVKPEGELTAAQVRKLDKLLSPAGEDTWFGDASRRAEVLALVGRIERPWTSRAEAERAAQQRIGGR